MNKETGQCSIALQEGKGQVEQASFLFLELSWIYTEL
jgi:hypothetical protein